jgi:hypothetical protein
MTAAPAHLEHLPIGRQAEADEYALLHLIARRMAWVTSAAQLPPQPVQQQVAQ